MSYLLSFSLLFNILIYKQGEIRIKPNPYYFVPYYVEDYYEIFSLPLYYQEGNLRRNLYYLKKALYAPFRHPVKALCKIHNQEEYKKYRRLLMMKINLLIMRTYMRIASLFDKEHLYFYNYDFVKDLKICFRWAEIEYKNAFKYWYKAKDLALKAYNQKLEFLCLDNLQSEMFLIATNKLDFEKIIKSHLKRLHKKQKLVNEYMKKYNIPDKKFPYDDYPG